MDQQQRAESTVSDESLVLQARAGDRSAFAELWERHARSGLTVARQFTSTIDADDLVSEAYTRIYQRVLDGGGPDGAFRPYLYTTIRNLASRWGGSRKDIQIEDIEDIESDTALADESIEALDKSLTVRAFRSLPERWQSVLWYTEVEGMDPHEVAPILGITANGVAALSYRAREGLRKAWLQAHVTAPGRTDECRWAINRLGDNARHALTDREQRKLDAHLSECLTCGIVAEEVDDVGSRLALVVLPLLLGATAGGTLLASLSAPTAASAASMPVMPPAFEAAAIVGTPAVAAGLGATATITNAVLVGALAVTIAVGGGVAVSVQTPEAVVDHLIATSEVDPGTSASVVEREADLLTQTGANGGSAAGEAAGGSTEGGSGLLNSITEPVSDLVSGLTDPINAILPIGPGPVPEHTAPEGAVGAVTNLDLFGTGMPNATVSAQVAGQVYTTVVANDGTWAIRITVLPDGIGPITLKQRLTVLGIAIPLDIPLSLLSDTLGVTVNLLN